MNGGITIILCNKIISSIDYQICNEVFSSLCMSVVFLCEVCIWVETVAEIKLSPFSLTLRQ